MNLDKIIPDSIENGKGVLEISGGREKILVFDISFRATAPDEGRSAAEFSSLEIENIIIQALCCRFRSQPTSLQLYAQLQGQLFQIGS